MYGICMRYDHPKKPLFPTRGNIKNNLVLIGKGGFLWILILSGGGFQEDPSTISWGGFSGEEEKGFNEVHRRLSFYIDHQDGDALFEIVQPLIPYPRVF